MLGAIRLGSPESEKPGLFRKKVAGTGSVIEHWGYNRSSAADYAAQAKVSVSPSGRSIVFTSDWNGEQAPDEFILQADEVTLDGLLH